MKKILAVIRTSTERQETESQKQELTNFIKTKGFKEEEIEFIEVAGASAVKLNAKYRQMLQSIKDKILQSDSIRTVAFWHLNRLGRNENAIVSMKTWFIENQIQVYVQTPSLTLLDTNGNLDAGANIAWGVFSSMASYDTKEMFAKMERGRKRNATNGQHVGGKPKYGYDVDRQKNYIINPEKAKVVRLTYELYLTGEYSIEKLTKELEKRGFPTNETKVWEILTDEGYTGKPSDFGTRYPAIISEETFQKAVEMRQRNVLEAAKETKNKYLCLKLIKCPFCGANYIAMNDFYACYRKRFPKRFTEEKRCKYSVGIRIKKVDDIIFNITKQLHIIQSAADTEKRVGELQKKLQETEAKLNAIDGRKEKVNTTIQRAKDLYMDGDLSKDEYARKKAQLKSKMDEIEAEEELYATDVERLEKMIDVVKNDKIDLAQLLSPAGDLKDFDTARRLVHTYIKKIEVVPETFNDRKVHHLIVIDSFGNVYDYFLDYYKNFCHEKLFNGNKLTGDFF